MKALLDLTVRAIYRIWRDRRHVKMMREIATIYNRAHTYAGDALVSGTWMCPTCNQVHACSGTSAWTGRQFGACCGFPEGHRLDQEHAAPHK